MAKAPGTFGENHPRAKFTVSMIEKIRLTLAEFPAHGMISFLARKYDVRRATIIDIRDRRTWKSVA